jgi:PAS domain-containing protein/two-component sensor histidine kinase
MSNLDERIAELQVELASLQEQRRQQMQRYGSEVEEAETGCFTVITPDELNLTALPELARAILDALPVQIFIKEAASHPQKGRRYTYLNKKVRKILGWSREKAKSAYDSEAFAGGVNNLEWLTMFTGETETIESRKARLRELSWTTETEKGESWRLNKVLEVPILANGLQNPIGFCAIAQDIEFNMFAGTHTQLRKVFRHEYSNLTASVLSHVEDVEEIIRLSQQGDNSPSRLPEALESLNAVKGRLLIAARAADVLYLAVGNIDRNSYDTVDKVIDEIGQLYQPAPFRVSVTVTDSVRSARIWKPKAIKGVLVELIRNAEKHYDPSVSNKEIPISARLDGGVVVWEVSNRCRQLNGGLDFESSAGSGQLVETRERFGAKIIRDILKRAYGVEASDMIEFPQAPTPDGWIRVKLRCKEEEK